MTRPLSPDIPTGQRGAALLTVLLLVAVMAVIAATALDRLTLSARIAGNAAAMDQARAFTLAAEALAVRRIDALVRRDAAQLTLAGDWMGRDVTLPLPGGVATAQVADGGNCFDLNSLVRASGDGGFVAHPAAVTRLARLMALLGVAPGDAQAVAAASADWMDSDAVPLPGGGEDSVYRGRSPGMLPANQPMADPSEFAAVQGVTPRIARLMRPWLCALPPLGDASDQGWAINVNTLRPAQAPLVAMLIPGEPAAGTPAIARIRAALAQRPADGFGSVYGFWQHPALAGLAPPADADLPLAVTTRWFRLKTSVTMGQGVGQARGAAGADDAARLDAVTWIDAGSPGAAGAPRVVRRMWGEE